MLQCEQGCNGIMIVLSGQMRTYISSEEGREVTLFRVFQDDVCVLSAAGLLDAIVQNLLCNTAGYTESADRITRGNRRQNADDQQAMRPPFQYIFITVYGYLLSLRKKHLVVLLRVKVRFVCGNNFYKAELLRGNPVNVFRADKL